MSRAVPSKPPTRPFQPTYTVTTTTRVPGRLGHSTRLDDVDTTEAAPEVTETP